MVLYGMLRISKMTDYAIQLMVSLYAAEQLQAGSTLSALKLAERTHLETPTVSKVMKLLCRQKLVKSARGAHGGYFLANSGADISVAEIIAAIEGPIAMTECSIDDGVCGQQPMCDLSTNWRQISAAVATALAAVSLAEMAVPAVNARHISGLQITTQNS